MVDKTEKKIYYPYWKNGKMVGQDGSILSFFKDGEVLLGLFKKQYGWGQGIKTYGDLMLAFSETINLGSSEWKFKPGVLKVIEKKYSKEHRKENEDIAYFYKHDEKSYYRIGSDKSILRFGGKPNFLITAMKQRFGEEDGKNLFVRFMNTMENYPDNVPVFLISNKQ